MTRIRPFLALSLLVLLTVPACAPASTTGGSRNRDVITLEDIQGTNYATAYEIVQRLRPQWLRARSAPSFGGDFQISVYVDNVRYGDEVGSLQSIPATNIEQLEWVDAGSATQRWGTGNAGGAIAVSTRRGG